MDEPLLQALKITTYLNGVSQESSTIQGLRRLQLLNTVGDASRQLVIMDTSAEFNAVELEKVATLGAISNLHVYSLCVAPPPL